MTYPFTLPEQFKIVDATAGAVTTNGGVTADYVNLAYCHKAYIVVQLTQAAAHATAIAIRQATSAAGASVKAIANAVEIWANEATGTSDALVRQTAAVSYTVTADIAKKLVIFEIDPAKLDLANGFDYLNFTVADSSEATNFVAATYILVSRYPQASVPGGPSVIS